MTSRLHSSERGQAAVLLVLAMVVLLGFAALAVDGSMVYSDRRFAQDGADAASLAGGAAAGAAMELAGIDAGNWPCPYAPSTDTVYTDAIPSDLSTTARDAVIASTQRAADNAFIIDNDITDNHGVRIYCGQEMVNDRLDRFVDVKVIITSHTQTAFAHFVFGGDMVNTVEAVTRVRPRHPFVYGNAIVALNPAGCQGQQNGVVAHGTDDTLVTGGGVFSNGCLNGVGNVQVNVAGGPGVYWVTDNEAQGGTYNPDPTQQQALDEAAYLLEQEPNCSDPAAHNMTALNFENQAKSVAGLSPGLYCVTGNVKFNAGDVVKGSQVTIFMMDGAVDINGGAEVNLTAPPKDPDPYPALPGMLFYAPPCDVLSSCPATEWTINGNENSHLTGTILVPGAYVHYLGTGGTDAYHSQLIAWDVEMGGTAALNVVYQDSEQAKLPTAMDLYR